MSDERALSARTDKDARTCKYDVQQRLASLVAVAFSSLTPFANTSSLTPFAAGNAGPELSTIGPPANAKNCLSVGASYGANQMADFSSRGYGDPYPIMPTVTASGRFVYSAAACPSDGVCSGQNTVCGVSSLSGTSMATPGEDMRGAKRRAERAPCSQRRGAKRRAEKNEGCKETSEVSRKGGDVHDPRAVRSS